MCGILLRIFRQWGWNNEDGMSAVTVLTAFSVLMVLLIFVTTAVMTSQNVLLEAAESRTLYEQAEEEFYLNPDTSDVMLQNIRFIPQNGGTVFSVEEAFFYRQSASANGKTVILYGFDQ